MANLRIIRIIISADSPVLFLKIASWNPPGKCHPQDTRPPALGQFVSTQNVGDFSGPEANIAMEIPIYNNRSIIDNFGQYSMPKIKKNNCFAEEICISLCSRWNNHPPIWKYNQSLTLHEGWSSWKLGINIPFSWTTFLISKDMSTRK